MMVHIGSLHWVVTDGGS